MTLEAGVWTGQSVFVTGHTGFKGSWLSSWLAAMGASVHGYSLSPPTAPSLFDAAAVPASLASDVRADLADLAQLRAAIVRAQPRVVFHLAAQSLVRESYRDPVGTFATNVIGTGNVLEAVRGVESVRAVIVVTTDKVYLNDERGRAYRESDPLGGHDPYSASKAAAELVAASYRASFFSAPREQAPHVATVRAGNVIGGGDWAADRLVPDCLRSFARHQPVQLRYPDAVRPWQHVLEPLAGYLMLAARLIADDGQRFAAAWNFGPDESGDATVLDVARAIALGWGPPAVVTVADGPPPPHEAGLLRLDSSAARELLGWQPRWGLPQAIAKTVQWHRAFEAGDDMRVVTLQQISEYMESVP